MLYTVIVARDNKNLSYKTKQKDGTRKYYFQSSLVDKVTDFFDPWYVTNVSCRVKRTLKEADKKI